MTKQPEPEHPQPLQPIVLTDGVPRFQPNAIVYFIVGLMLNDYALPTFNQLMAMNWSDEDRDQFNQLHGYSVSGLPWRNEERQEEAHEKAKQVRQARRNS